MKQFILISMLSICISVLYGQSEDEQNRQNSNPEICILDEDLIEHDSSRPHRAPALLVISGGGARGAWGAGLLKALEEEKAFDYKYIVGTSTGALMAPLVALGEFDLLDNIYTQTSRKKILERSLYKQKKGKFRTFRFIKRVLFKKESATSSKPLRNLLEEKITDEAYINLQDDDVAPVVVASHNLDLGGTYYYSAKDWDRKEMLDWIWASANQPVFMSPVYYDDKFSIFSDREDFRLDAARTNTAYIGSIDIGDNTFEHRFYAKGLKWVDGGASENVPIQHGLEATRAMDLSDVVIVINNKPPKQLFTTPAIEPQYLTKLDTRGSEERDFIRVSQKTHLNEAELALLFESTHELASFEKDLLDLKGNFKTKKDLIEILLATIDGFSREIMLTDISNAVLSPLAWNKRFHVFFMPIGVYNENPLSLLFNQADMEKQFRSGERFKFNDAARKTNAQYFSFTVNLRTFTNMLQYINTGDFDLLINNTFSPSNFGIDQQETFKF